jgi:hypothetical protein
MINPPKLESIRLPTKEDLFNKGYTSCGAPVDGRLFVQEYVRSSCVSGHRFVNLVHKHSYGFVHLKPNTFVPNKTPHEGIAKPLATI